MDLNLDFFKNKRVLITGGGGYLGSKLAHKLLTASLDALYLLDISFNESSMTLFSNPIVKSISVDIRDYEKTKSACKMIHPDVIYHFAASLNRERSFSIYDYLYGVNVIGTFNILRCFQETEYCRFFYSSTSEIYGEKNPSPFNETMVPRPVSPYSLTKLMAENLVNTFSGINNKPFTILRVFNYFGPDMPKSLFFGQLENALKNNVSFEMTEGEQIRDYLAIDELVQIIIKLTSKIGVVGETINICSGKGITIKELALEYSKKMNKIHLLKIGFLPYRQKEIWRMVGDKAKLFSLLDKD